MIQVKSSYFSENGDFNADPKKQIQELLTKAEPYFKHRTDLYDRYRRKTGVNNFMTGKMGTLVAFEHSITGIAKGFLGGKTPVYSFDENTENYMEYEQYVSEIRKHNDDPSTFAELIHDFIVTGAAYIYISENTEKQVEYTKLSSRNTIVIYDYSVKPKPLALLRKWEQDSEKRIELITATSKRQFKADGEPLEFYDYNESGELDLIQEKPLYWGDVPVVGIEHPDGIAVFEPALELIDAYENMLTNMKNMTQYNDTAKLVSYGYSQVNQPMYLDEEGNERPNPAWQAEMDLLYQTPALFLPNGGDVKWLIKDVNYVGMISVLKQLEELISMTTGVPGMTDDMFAGNSSGVALEFKMYALSQYATTVDREFKRGFTRLWKIITDRINMRKDTTFDHTAITITSQHNTPTRDGEKLTGAVNAFKNGLFSHETAIRISGVEVDPIEEIERIQAENAALQELETEMVEDSENDL
ncbi:MAG: phage portal protein [Firmicutes bacterium]|nr:phage portal protein [Bacillota bacterium]